MSLRGKIVELWLRARIVHLYMRRWRQQRRYSRLLAESTVLQADGRTALFE